MHWLFVDHELGVVPGDSLCFSWYVARDIVRILNFCSYMAKSKFLSYLLRYSFMYQCWSGEPEHRPSFSQLVESLSSSLEEMAGYVHIGAFGIRTRNEPEDSQH